MLLVTVVLIVLLLLSESMIASSVVTLLMVVVRISRVLCHITRDDLFRACGDYYVYVDLNVFSLLAFCFSMMKKNQNVHFTHPVAHHRWADCSIRIEWQSLIGHNHRL